MSSLSLLILGIIGIICNAECEFSDAGNSGQILDLTALEFATMFYQDSGDNQWAYQFTPCRGYYQCSGDVALARKYLGESDNPTECIVMTNWNAEARNVLPTFTNSSGQWIFNYTLGNECGDNNEPYAFEVHFWCDMTQPADFKVISAATIETCKSTMTIRTKWACPGEVYTTTPAPEADSMSGGSIFVIVLFVGFLSYCLIGYCINSILNRKDHPYWDCEANIPHLVFWIKLPTLALAGCCFTKDFLLALMGCDGNSSDKTQDLVGNNSDPEVPNPFASEDFDE